MAFIGVLPAAATRIGQMQTAAPFTWGKGGQRRTPEQVAIDSRVAQALMAEGSDYSPIGHWTQGLARLSQGIMGGLKARDARRAEEANMAESAAVRDRVMSGPLDQSTVLGALLSPYIDSDTKRVVQSTYEASMPKERKLTADESLIAAAGFTPGTPEFQAQALQLLAGKNDPFITANLPSGDFYSGRQSGLANIMKGGGQASTGQPPAVLPPDFDFGGPASKAPGTFPRR